MKILHVIPNEKFTKPFINFLNDKFDQNNHRFLIINNKEYGFNKRKNVHILDDGIKGYFEMFNDFIKFDKIILHGLFNNRIIILLFLNPFITKKCYWVIWGGDLYSYRLKKNTLKSKINEFMKSKVIKNIRGLITHIKGDYELAVKWYNSKGEYFYSFMYPSNLYNNMELNIIDKGKEKNFNIQVGNSADPSNNHLEIFEILLNLKQKDFNIICPLSYGNKHYAKEVIERGKYLFGERFTPLTKFMPFEEYLEILAKIDIAIFNHNRQQAVGNITTLLGLGKKVYIREHITTWEFCKYHNLKVYSIDRDLGRLFESLSDEVRDSNIEMVKKHFSEEKLVTDWRKIFLAKN